MPLEWYRSVCRLGYTPYVCNYIILYLRVDVNTKILIWVDLYACLIFNNQNCIYDTKKKIPTEVGKWREFY